jgi:hypothetical protein
MKPLQVFSLFLLIVCLMTIAAHAQKPGEIVFSKSMISPSDPSGLTTQFQAGDKIYAVAFFDKSIENMSQRKGQKKVETEIFLYELTPPLYDYQEPSETQLETSALTVSGETLQKKFLPVDIVPAPTSMTAYGNADLAYKKFGKSYYGPVKFAEALGKLDGGEHTIIVKVRCNYNFVAEGKFTITGDDFGGYAEASEQLNAAVSNLVTQDAKMPAAAKTDKGLEAEMVKAFTASQTYKDRVKGEVIRVSIIDPDWMIRRNALTGVILHRYIRAAIAVKNSDGSCTVWQNVTFQQDYVSNKFQQTRFDGIGDPFKIPCENVGK